jgi:hypothetical protein
VLLFLAGAIVNDDLVETLVLLFEALDSEDGRVRLAIGPRLEAAALALSREVFEALKAANEF